jgi:Tfp pilus assembly protein PilF
MQKALITNKNSIDLWIRLAEYYRLNYDLQKATGAITKALELSKKNPRANLENARIKKALGKIKDYQVILNSVLVGFKEKYRENEYDANSC